MKLKAMLLSIFALNLSGISVASTFHWGSFVEQNWDKPKHECITRTSGFKEVWYHSWDQDKELAQQYSMENCRSESNRPISCRPLTCLEVRSHRWIRFHIESASGRNIFNWVTQNWNRNQFECNSKAGLSDSWFFDFGNTLQEAKENSLEYCRSNARNPNKCRIGSCYEVKSDEWIELHSSDIG